MRRAFAAGLAALVMFALGADAPPARRANAPIREEAAAANAAETAAASPGREAIESLAASPNVREALGRSLPTVAIFALASLVPAAVLMITAFVRIQVVLLLVRQALGSPQIPGNQVLSALALLLTTLVMMPVFQQVYERGIDPYASGRLGVSEAWNAGTAPLKVFMVDQVVRTGHKDYLWRLYDHTRSGTPAQADPTDYEQFPLQVVAPAFLLSELTTALVMGFAIYLPLLVVDLVVSAVLAAMGLFMLPPALVALPLKLILFVLADGWFLVADTLIRSFTIRTG